MQTRPLKIFLSAASKDSGHRDELVDHLKQLNQPGREITIWHRGEMLGGDRKKEVVQKEIKRADLFLFLVSINSLVKDLKCKEDLELIRGLEREERATLVPIILKHCLWESWFPGVEPLPADGIPILDWPSEDKVYTEIVENLRTRLEKLSERSLVPIFEPEPPSRTDGDGETELGRLALSRPARPKLKADCGKNFHGPAGDEKRVDLEIRVHLEKDQLRFHVSSPDHAPFDLNDGHRLHRPVRGYLELVHRTLQELDQLLGPEGVAISKADANQELQKLGNDLYDEFFPPRLKTAYWQLRNKFHIETVWLITNEPWIPWEVVRPYEGNRSDDHLGVQFHLTRWLSTVEPPPDPPLWIRTTQIVAVAAGSPSERPPHAIAERELLGELADRCGVKAHCLDDPSRGQLAATLKAHDVGIIHLAGHGERAEDNPDASGLRLSSSLPFRPVDLDYQICDRLRRNRPLIMLNACELGQAGQGLTRLSGWAPRCLGNALAGAFVAPLWAVDDELAFSFAKVLYRALEKGLTFGEAASLARRTIRDEGGLEWLAYTIYAHPNGRLDFGPDAPGSSMHPA